MIRKIRREDRLRVLVYVLLIALCITMLPITVLGDEITDGEDVSVNVNIGSINVTYYEGGLWKTYMTGGAIVDGENDKIFERGTNMRFYVTWSVSNSNIKNIKEGDFFHVDIPSTYFTFSDLGPVNVSDSNGKLIGNYTVSNQKMKVVFSSIVDDPKTTEIKDGWLMAKGSLNSSEVPNNIISMGGIAIPLTATGPAISEGGNDQPLGPLDPSKRGPANPLVKGSWMNNDQHTANWYIDVNHDMYRAKYNGLSSYGTKNNLIIEDKLQDGQKFKDIQFYHRYFYAFKDDDDSLSMASQYFDVYYNIAQTFTKVEATSGEDYTSFKNRVLTEGQTGQKPAYGIWQDKNVIISLGNIPGKMAMPLTYGELKTKLEENEYNGSLIPDDVQQNTLSVYADKFYMGTSDDSIAPAYSLNIRIGTSVTGNDRSINNEAYMYWGDDDYTTAGAFVRFESIAGGAELGIPGSVTIRKYDADTESSLDGVKFKLQKMNSDGIYEDYFPSDGNAVRSTSGGSIVYYDLDYGQYKVVETETLPGYSDKITFGENEGMFSINGSESATIYVDAYNYSETVKGQTDNPGSDVDSPTVLGQEDVPAVLGKEAKTADISNITPLLVIMLIVMIIMLIISLQYTIRKE